MKKLLVAGANGMLGRRVVELASSDFELFPCDIEECDITNIEETCRFVEAAGPDVVINCAAMTDVDGCETRRDAAMKVNGNGAGNLAVAARKAGASILQVSTDYVFDGEKEGEYSESDPIAALGAYGRSKLLGEELVREGNSRHWIVRTQWLYGAEGKNFVDTILRVSTERDELRVVDDQIGSPTSTVDLARQMIRIVVEEAPFGVYHCSSGGRCSWYDFAARIVELAGRDGVSVTPITSDELSRPAPRPPCSVLRNLRLEQTIGDGMPHWLDALRVHMAALGYGEA
jgi:dTDP-4-dehydrorhamnose reductase